MAIKILEKITSKFDAEKIIYQLNSRVYLIETNQDVYECTIKDLHKYIKNEKKRLKKSISISHGIKYKKVCDGIWSDDFQENIWKRIFSPYSEYEIAEIFYNGIINTNNIKYKNNIININGNSLSIKLPIFKTWAAIGKKKDNYLFKRQAFFEYKNDKYYIPYGNQSNFKICTVGSQYVKDLKDSDVYFHLFQTKFSNHGLPNFSVDVISENIIIHSNLIEKFRTGHEFIKYLDDKFMKFPNDHKVSKIEVLYYISLQAQNRNIDDFIRFFKPLSRIDNPFEGI